MPRLQAAADRIGDDELARGGTLQLTEDNMGSIYQLFEASVAQFAERPALIEPVTGGEMSTMTYQALQEQVRCFAGYLQEQQIGKGDRVCIWAASCSSWMIAYLGALLVGAVVVPLDVNTTEDFLTRIAETTEAKLLVTTQKQYAGLKQPPLPLVDVEALPQGTLDTTKLPKVNGDDLAELVFTSGTTGQPKGVMLSHRNITSNATAAVGVVDIHPSDRLLSILPLSHMFEMTVEIAVLYRGASVVYARSLIPDTLLKLLETQQVTCMMLVPQALQLLLNGIEREVRRQKRQQQWEMLQRIASRLPFAWRRILFGTVHKRFGGHFRFFISGGAYLSPKLAERWENMGFRVMQGYGATECAPIVSFTPYNEHMLDSVGKPLPGVDVRIAEDKEILVHGPNIALGYWRNPEATAAAFEDGWYHTGDLGYLDAMNNLYLKGRKKNLVVLANGMNVYPEDIENVLCANPLIKNAVVFGLMEKDQEPEVRAVLLMDDPSEAKSVIQHTNKQLASHQRVHSYTIWPDPDFPCTHTLKVKRSEVLNKLQAIRQEAERALSGRHAEGLK
jgi:long-chain acyl-CoA synthetase